MATLGVNATKLTGITRTAQIAMDNGVAGGYGTPGDILGLLTADDLANLGPLPVITQGVGVAVVFTETGAAAGYKRSQISQANGALFIQTLTDPGVTPQVAQNWFSLVRTGVTPTGMTLAVPLGLLTWTTGSRPTLPLGAIGFNTTTQQVEVMTSSGVVAIGAGGSAGAGAPNVIRVNGAASGTGAIPGSAAVPYQMAANDRVIEVVKGSNAAPTTLLWPASPMIGYEYKVIDGQGDAGTNNITVQFGSGVTVTGEASGPANSLVISSTWSARTVIPTSATPVRIV